MFASVCIVILIGLARINAKFINGKLPCDYFDSINISHGVKQNQSIKFDGIEYREDQYAEINYVIINEVHKQVKPYFRGCICNIVDCIQFCCPPGTYADFMTIKSKPGSTICNNNHTESPDFDHSIEKYKKEQKNFKFIHNMPCNEHFFEEEYKINSVSIYSFPPSYLSPYFPKKNI